jgi:hypothetical protein
MGANGEPGTRLMLRNSRVLAYKMEFVVRSRW